MSVLWELHKMRNSALTFVRGLKEDFLYQNDIDVSDSVELQIQTKQGCSLTVVGNRVFHSNGQVASSAFSK